MFTNCACIDQCFSCERIVTILFTTTVRLFWGKRMFDLRCFFVHPSISLPLNTVKWWWKTKNSRNLWGGRTHKTFETLASLHHTWRSDVFHPLESPNLGNIHCGHTWLQKKTLNFKFCLHLQPSKWMDIYSNPISIQLIWCSVVPIAGTFQVNKSKKQVNNQTALMKHWTEHFFVRLYADIHRSIWGSS